VSPDSVGEGEIVGKGRPATINMATSRAKSSERSKRLTVDERATAARSAFSLAKKSNSLREAIATIKKTYSISETTARNLIRRGRHLVNRAKQAKDARR
jgi:hypothetical protein